MEFCGVKKCSQANKFWESYMKDCLYFVIIFNLLLPQTWEFQKKSIPKSNQNNSCDSSDSSDSSNCSNSIKRGDSCDSSDSIDSSGILWQNLVCFV